MSALRRFVGDGCAATALKGTLAIACCGLLLGACAAPRAVTNRPVAHHAVTNRHAVHRVVHARTVVKQSIPLPDPSLLAPQSAPDCKFSGPVSSPMTAEELRMKLDYEQQCYRQAEEITRTRLRQLQEAVDKTIRASERSRR
jgi:hypothetical protein